MGDLADEHFAKFDKPGRLAMANQRTATTPSFCLCEATIVMILRGLRRGRVGAGIRF